MVPGTIADQQFVLLVVSYLVGGVVFCVGLGWWFSGQFRRMSSEFEGKIKKIYERFDSYKGLIEDKIEKSYTRKDLCQVKHANMTEVIAEMKLSFSSLVVEVQGLRKDILTYMNKDKK